jgi:Fe(3+) dicitrate transport protein
MVGTLQAQPQNPTGTISGRLSADPDSIVTGASVLLEGTTFRTRAGRDGSFALDSVPVGSYTLVVSGVNISPKRQQVAVQADRLTHLEIAVVPRVLKTVVVVGSAAKQPVAYLPDTRGTEVFAGKKTEVVSFDDIHVNTAQDITREYLARVPGANISETENSGFPSNGIGFRGLNPVQSVEMNVRQNGINIAADIYGYPETYYTPPPEAVDRIELVRGSSSLQFGPQFGGVVDYVMREGRPNTPLSFTTRQTGGSFGVFNSYNALAGGTEHWTYFGFLQYRGQQGWRENSDLRQVAGYGNVTYRPNDAWRFGLEYTLLRNRIHMPGGLTDEEFDENAQQSFRARNWLASPWNIISGNADWQISPSTRLSSTLSVMFSQRYLVWRNEDGGAAAPDTVDPGTAAFTPREVEWEYFNNVTNETRLLHTYSLFGATQSLATGFRVFGGNLHRQEGGMGTTGSDFDMTLVDPYETDVKFGNSNVSLYAENVFRFGDRFSLTPGARLEFLHSTANGYTDTTFSPQTKNRTFALFGMGAEYQMTNATRVYANITQAYRPVEYSFLTPFASVSRVDPNMVDPRGYNADIGWRGSLGRVLNFDVGAFLLAYHDRIGLVTLVDSSGASYTERRNVANSLHKGLEAYLDLPLSTLLRFDPRWGQLGVYDSFAYTDARYTSGPFDKNFVEYAPEVVNRVGITYAIGAFNTRFQASVVSKQYGDANNTVASSDPNVGLVPAYQVFDWSAGYKFGTRYVVSGGINNLADEHYFTRRTDEYPGPGIIPAIGRSIYLTLGASF